MGSLSAADNVAKFCAKPTKHCWNSDVWSPQAPIRIADWGGDLDDRKSTSGYVFQIGEVRNRRSTAQESVWLHTDIKKEPLSHL